MNANDLLEELRDRGITVECKRGELELEGDRRALTDELVSKVRSHKSELIRALRGATTGPVATGHRIRLCGYLRRSVSTPKGRGKLLQVFEDRATVVLYAYPGRAEFFDPAEVVIIEAGKAR